MKAKRALRQSRLGRTNNYSGRSRIRDNYDIDYVTRSCYIPKIPLIEGRFLEAFPEGGAGGGVPGRLVKPLPGGSGPLADRTQAPGARVARLRQRRQLRSRSAGTGPKTVTVERREASSRLRGTAHASQTWCRVVTGATGLRIPPPGAPPSPRSGMRKLRRKNPGTNVSGTKRRKIRIS